MRTHLATILVAAVLITIPGVRAECVLKIVPPNQIRIKPSFAAVGWKSRVWNGSVGTIYYTLVATGDYDQPLGAWRTVRQGTTPITENMEQYVKLYPPPLPEYVAIRVERVVYPDVTSEACRTMQSESKVTDWYIARPQTAVPGKGVYAEWNPVTIADVPLGGTSDVTIALLTDGFSRLSYRVQASFDGAVRTNTSLDLPKAKPFSIRLEGVHGGKSIVPVTITAILP